MSGYETKTSRRADRERGQAMVEFAIVAPLFFMIVAGIIQFGLALNYWIDMQRIANQGARWAVVARYPQSNGVMCTASTPPPCGESLVQVLENQALSAGLNPDVTICFPSGTDTVGNPVKIRLDTDFALVPILEIGTLNLGADAEMRIEQPRNNVYNATTPPPGLC